jgi:hypothetical protein
MEAPHALMHGVTASGAFPGVQGSLANGFRVVNQALATVIALPLLNPWLSRGAIRQAMPVENENP